jgi:hypothetical protein
MSGANLRARVPEVCCLLRFADCNLNNFDLFLYERTASIWAVQPSVLLIPLDIVETNVQRRGDGAVDSAS